MFTSMLFYDRKEFFSNKLNIKGFLSQGNGLGNWERAGTIFYCFSWKIYPVQMGVSDLRQIA